MSQKSIKKNFIYNFILTFTNMIFPILISPYLSRVLGATNIGKVNYATSIVNWFIIFASWGVPRYGMREIARNRDDKENMSNIFWNLIIIQAIFTVIVGSIYIFIILSVDRFREEISLHLLMILTIILNIFSIDWFYQGIEEYKYISVRNVIVKIMSIFLLFLTVKNENDYLIYALINICALSLNNILNYKYSLKFIYKKIYNIRFMYFIRESRVFFLIALIIALYTQLDQLIIGTISEKELAFFMRAKSLLGAGLTLTTAFINVVSPRASYLAHNNKEEYKKIIQKSVNYIYLFGIPIMFGITLLSKESMFILGGSEFIPASISLQLMAPTIIFISIGSWLSGQILIPNKLEKQSLKIQLKATIISIILNIIFIPKLTYIGATITWLIVEIYICLSKTIYIKFNCKDINFEYFTVSFYKFLISSIVMSVIVLFIKLKLEKDFIVLLASIIAGSMTYFITLLILQEKIVINTKEIICSRIKKVNKGIYE